MSSAKFKSNLSAYDDFAWFYDRHWVSEVGPQFLAATERLLLPQLGPGAEILDLCCGTGQLAADLSDRGYAVTGIDSSAEMLAIARERTPEARFIQADVREFSAPGSYDAAVCLFDSINHFLDLTEVEAVFRSARRAVKPGGLFLFDVNTELAFREHWEEYYSILEPDHVCVLNGRYVPAKHLAHYDITLFRQTETGWNRLDTRIEERCYELDELAAAVRDAGFENCQQLAADTEVGLEDHTGRVFFLCS